MSSGFVRASATGQPILSRVRSVPAGSPAACRLGHRHLAPPRPQSASCRRARRAARQPIDDPCRPPHGRRMKRHTGGRRCPSDPNWSRGYRSPASDVILTTPASPANRRASLFRGNPGSSWPHSTNEDGMWAICLQTKARTGIDRWAAQQQPNTSGFDAHRTFLRLQPGRMRDYS